MPLIIDASVALAWALPDERSKTSLALLNLTAVEGVVVPAHFAAEVANGLWKSEPKRITPNESAEFIDRLRSLDIAVDLVDQSAMFSSVLPLARAHRLTVYDAVYLELAERSGLALATFDEPLANAARSVGLEVYS